MLVIDDVHKSYGSTRALRGVALTIERGQICAVLGPNGAGKTTLISIVAGLVPADAGSVHVDGRLGLVPQDIGVYPTLAVRANLVFHGELHGLAGAALDTRIDEVAAATLLDSLLDRTAAELSGGEKRRLHTAMAMLHRPDLLLLDEPTAAADVQTRAALLDVVRDLADNGTAICYTTHYLHEVEELDADVVIIDHGSVVAAGRVTELLEQSSPSVVQMTLTGGKTIRVDTDDPVAALAQLGPAAAELQSLEVITPTLESAYLALTEPRDQGRTR